MDILIYLEQDNSRTRYIFNHIFKRVLGLTVKCTTDLNEFDREKGPKFEYSKKKHSDGLFFSATNLLFETNISKQELFISSYKSVKVLFSSLDSSSCLPFDPFAASFYMLTRYEEYLINKKDKFGRFSATSSIAYKYNFLNLPVVDYWILFIKEKLKEKYPNLIFKSNKFKFYNTIDVDNGFAYLGKGFFRTLGSLLKDVFQLNFIRIKHKIRVLLFKEKDPYDNYDYLLKLHRKYSLNTLFFFLLSDYGKYDKNVLFSSKKLHQRIKTIYQSCDIGIHASYR